MAGARSRDTMEQSTGVKKDLEDQRQNLIELEELHRNCSDVRAGCSTALAAEHEKWVQGDRDVRAELLREINVRLRALEEREEQHTPQVKSLSSRMRALEERQESDKFSQLNLAELRNQRDRDAEKLAEVRRELAAMAGARSRDTMEQSTSVKKDLEDQRQSLIELEKELHRNCSDVRRCSTALAAEHEKWVQGDRDVRAEVLREINAEKKKRSDELSQQREDFIRAMRERHEHDKNASPAVKENGARGWLRGSNGGRESAPSEQELLGKQPG